MPLPHYMAIKLQYVAYPLSKYKLTIEYYGDMKVAVSTKKYLLINF